MNEKSLRNAALKDTLHFRDSIRKHVIYPLYPN